MLLRKCFTTQLRLQRTPEIVDAALPCAAVEDGPEVGWIALLGLRGEPVEARRATALGRLSRWCVRTPGLAALGSAVLLLSLLVAAVTFHKNVQLKTESELGREKLRDSYLAQARAARLSGQPGQRFGSRQTLLEAAKIRPGPELCDEAAASLALNEKIKSSERRRPTLANRKTV